jgi:pyridoxamine 5'-phosphate oxidase
MSEKPDLGLDLDDLPPEPMTQFRVWFEDAENEGIHLASAVALATATPDGDPMVRHVLLRGFDERGFVVYTNRESRKGRDLAANPRAAFAVLWRELDRQVVVTGRVTPTDDEESNAYFRTRPREARVGAWASRQGSVLNDRAELMARFEEIDRTYDDDVPLPPYWGGYRIVPRTVEFWLARAFRLHDRVHYVRDEDGWRVERLSP